MFYSLILLSLLITPIYSQNNPCLVLNNKLAKHGIHLRMSEKETPGLRACQGLINDSCCPQIDEDQLQNATATELFQLFELHSVRLYEPLLRATTEWNDTTSRLIESSRNATHLLFQGDHKVAYRSSFDLFFNNLLTSTYKTHRYDIRNYVDELFRQLLRTSIEFNHVNQSRIPSYFLCLWRNHPFGERPNAIANQLEVHLGKLFHLNEVLKLSIELVQVMSTSVTTDNHCIDTFTQLTYCNLCSGRTELPCLSDCVNTIESCLVNISLINDIWVKFIDSLENVAYFNAIESALSSISTSLFDAVMTFLNADGTSNKKIINQCGSVPMRKEILPRDQKILAEHRNSVSSLDQQLTSTRQSLKLYRSFWSTLPEQICQSNGLSIKNENLCWTGMSLSRGERRSSRPTYDKPLSLRLQWLLKEISSKSHIIGKRQQAAAADNSTTATANQRLSAPVTFTLPDDLDDYPNDDELHYSDYAYEDSPDESTTASTTRRTPTSSLDDNLLLDEINTVSYYDYGEQDVYIDEQIDESSTQRPSPLPTITTTTANPIPPHHRRQPIIWNINIDNNELTHPSTEAYNSCSLLNHSLLSSAFLLFLLAKIRRR